MATTSAFKVKHIPDALYERDNSALLTGILRGVEKEGLRATADKQLAKTPHPVALGSALTHPQITTDFSEALLEFITPPNHRLHDTVEQLGNLHRFTLQNLPDELIWSSSMPCITGASDDIPVAQYGSSNRAQMKTIYRVGLGNRYGRIMQTVAGLHYNFSLPSPFWAFLHQHENSTEDLGEFTTRRYFDLIRNFRRHYWVLIYLFGASPAVDRSFVTDREHHLLPLKSCDRTLHLPYATSLRMGDLGYQSSAQESLHVCYNSRASYVETLADAIETPYPPYAAIGLQEDSGQYRQLNTSLLQIENEFYSAIRPKRTAQAGETALTALCQRGVEYIEVRCLDIDPFEPNGINPQQMRFLDTFLLYCLLKDSPECDAAESDSILANQKRVVTEGRKPNLQLTRPNSSDISLADWGHELLDALRPVAQLLDSAHGKAESYQQALHAQLQKLDNPETTPSARVLAEITENGSSFIEWAHKRSIQHKEHFLAQPLTEQEHKRQLDMAEESLVLLSADEKEPQEPLAEYLAAYYAQYKDCALNP